MTSEKLARRKERATTWRYDELRQVGIDFEHEDRVRAYDESQGSSRDEERALIGRLGITAAQDVVDLGCGTGSFALEAAELGARVRAIDVSEPMLDFVRRAASARGLTTLVTEHAGFLTFDAAPRSADFVVTRFALHHLPDFWKQVALLRIADALRPGGVLYLRDVVFSFAAREYEARIEDWVARMPEQSGFSRADFETHVRDEYSTFSWVLEGLVERAGLTITERAHPSLEYTELVCTRALGPESGGARVDVEP